jgi:hypothetical protein
VSQHGLGLGRDFGIRQFLLQASDLTAVDLGQVWMDGRERDLDGYVLQIRFLRLQTLQPLLGSGSDDAALDRVPDAGDPAIDLRKLRFPWPATARRSLGLAAFDGVPKLIIDDLQVRHADNHLAARRVEAGDPPAGCRVLDKALPAPHQTTAIKLAGRYSGALPGASSNGRITTGMAPRARHPAFVEPPCKGSRSLAGGEAAKDLAHDPGLGLMGPALTPH